MNKDKLNSNTIYVYIQTYQLAKKYLIRALDSIQGQTYTNFKCLIYDNCSEKDVRLMLQEYVKKDKRFSLTHFDNTGEHIIVWEYGIPEILHLAGNKGGYYCIVDADDELELDCFEKLVSYMEKNDLDMVAGGSTFINADTMAPIGIRTIQTNTILAGDSFETHFSEYYQIMRTHWGKLYKIDIIKKMNLSNLNVVPYGRDTLFVREAMLKSKRVGILSDLVYKYYLYSGVRVYNLQEGRKEAPKTLLERDVSFILQKCGKISSNTIAWLINVYLQENLDAFNLIVNGQDDSSQKIEDIYSVLSAVPCRMAIRLGAGKMYTYLCDWLLHQNILENDLILSRCAEIFGMLCVMPNQIPNGGNADYFRFLIRLYDFWDDYDSKQMLERSILNSAQNSLLLQECDFYYCKFNAEIVEFLLRENYENAYEKIKETIEKKNYFDEQFSKKNVELGQNVAAILQDEKKFIYMNKRKIELQLEDDVEGALAEVNEWIELLPDDDELTKLKRDILDKQLKKLY